MRALIIIAAALLAMGCNVVSPADKSHTVCTFLPTGQKFHMDREGSDRGNWWISMETDDGIQMFMTSATADKWQCAREHR